MRRSYPLRLPLLTVCLSLLALTGCQVGVDLGGGQPKRPRPSVRPAPEVPVVNIPRSLREWNWGGGSCVHASEVMHLRWSNALAIAQYWRGKYSGGESYNGLTEKLRRNGIKYYSTHNGDVAVLDRCHAERRGAVIFYYPNHSILLVHFDQQRAIVLDNNRIEQFIEIPRETFIRNWRGYGGVAVVSEVGAPAPPLPWVAQR